MPPQPPPCLVSSAEVVPSEKPQLPHGHTSFQWANSQGLQLCRALNFKKGIKTMALAHSAIVDKNKTKLKDRFLTKDILHGQDKHLFAKEPIDGFTCLRNSKRIEIRKMVPQRSSLTLSQTGAWLPSRTLTQRPSCCLHVPEYTSVYTLGGQA